MPCSFFLAQLGDALASKVVDLGSKLAAPTPNSNNLEDVVHHDDAQAGEAHGPRASPRHAPVRGASACLAQEARQGEEASPLVDEEEEQQAANRAAS